MNTFTLFPSLRAKNDMAAKMLVQKVCGTHSFMATFMDDAAKADYLERFSGEVSQLRVNTL